MKKVQYLKIVRHNRVAPTLCQTLSKRLEANSILNEDFKEDLISELSNRPSMHIHQIMLAFVRALKVNFCSQDEVPHNSRIEKSIQIFLSLLKESKDISHNLSPNHVEMGTTYLIQCYRLVELIPFKMRQKCWRNLLQFWFKDIEEYKGVKTEIYWVHFLFMNIFNVIEHFQEKKCRQLISSALTMVRNREIFLHSQIIRKIVNKIQAMMLFEDNIAFQVEQIIKIYQDEEQNIKAKRSNSMPSLPLNNNHLKKFRPRLKSTQHLKGSKIQLPKLDYNVKRGPLGLHVSKKQNNLFIQKNRKELKLSSHLKNDFDDGETHESNMAEIYKFRMKMMVCQRNSQKVIQEKRRSAHKKKSFRDKVMKKKATTIEMMLSEDGGFHSGAPRRSVFCEFPPNLISHKESVQLVGKFIKNIRVHLKYTKILKQKYPYMEYWKSLAIKKKYFIGIYNVNILRKTQLFEKVIFIVEVQKKYFYVSISYADKPLVFLEKIKQSMSKSEEKKIPLQSHIYNGNIDLLAIEDEEGEQQFKVGKSIKYQETYQNSFFVKKIPGIRKQRKKNLVHRANMIYAEYFLKDYYADKVVFDEYFIFNKLVSKLQKEEEWKQMQMLKVEHPFFYEVVESPWRPVDSIYKLLMHRKSYLMVQLYTVNVNGDSHHLVIRSVNSKTLKENIILIVNLSNFSSQTLLRLESSLAKSAFENITQIKKHILKYRPNFTQWEYLTFNKNIISTSCNTVIVKSIKKNFYRIRYYQYHEENIIIWIHETSTKKYFSVSTWEDLFSFVLKKLGHLARRSRRTALNIKNSKDTLQNRNRKMITYFLQTGIPNLAFEGVVHEQIKKVIRIDDEEQPLMFISEKTFFMRPFMYHWIDRDDKCATRFCFFLNGNYRVFSIKIKQLYSITKVYKLPNVYQDNEKEENYKKFQQVVKEKGDVAYRYVKTIKDLCTLKKYNNKMQIEVLRTGKKFVLEHPAELVSDFLAPSKDKLFQSIYRNQRMIRRGLKAMDQAIFDLIRRSDLNQNE